MKFISLKFQRFHETIQQSQNIVEVIPETPRCHVWVTKPRPIPSVGGFKYPHHFPGSHPQLCPCLREAASRLVCIHIWIAMTAPRQMAHGVDPVFMPVDLNTGTADGLAQSSQHSGPMDRPPNTSRPATHGIAGNQTLGILNHDGEDGSSPQPRKKRPRPENTRTGNAYQRKRAITACKACRARKIKCNNARPSCGSCLASMSPCVYEDRQDLSPFDPASILILDRLNQVLKKLEEPPRCQSDAHARAAVQSLTPASRFSTSQHQVEPTVNGDEYDELHIPSGKTTPDAVLQWPIFDSKYPPDHVHIKNPILETKMIWNYAQRVAEDGVGWDCSSCFVMLVCALGCVAQPYHPAPTHVEEQVLASLRTLGRTEVTSLKLHDRSLQDGEKYFNLARRRLGSLFLGIRAAQCHFLAGIYLMYTMRPLQAWLEFHSATRAYQVYVQCQARRGAHAGALAPEMSKRRKLEQRLYWSCYKSECELRVEMDIPNSLLAEFHHPDLYPSPPDLPSPIETTEAISPQNLGSQRANQTPQSLEIQRQQEQSWFYYLTEITFRRIANRVLNVLYRDGPSSWNDESMPFMASMTREFEQQLEDWKTHLPPLIHFDETSVAAEELPFMVHGRATEIRTWIYRPFVYYAIHNPADAPCRELVQPFVEKGLLCSIETLGDHLALHRHHGTWYALRSDVAASLSVIGAVRCGTIQVPPKWKNAVETGLARMKFWEGEVPGLSRSIELVEDHLTQLLDAQGERPLFDLPR
ncbi:uncharacterized protein N7496_007327 [Penicillium cataractarum]|uniref:Zn(2)-C6 fungal-type domain-containing protein n=1 Tax=Penicillium cataractarum TaxID=2100454 RepID=A0A9W9S4K5_9EURO|nr:uncharacterized protein N7496_007327 [Penicillium cataractarum]KAJ5371235.1 hypothetical protein N7496_007327 [Penicillium cataractarum]